MLFRSPVPSFSVRSWFFAPFRSHRGFGTLPNKQFLTDKAGRNTEKGTLFLCLLRKFFLLPTTPGMSDLANFRKRKTLQPQKRLQRFLVFIQFLPDSGYFSSLSTSAISRAVAVTIRIPVSLISSSRASSCRRWVFFPAGCSKRNYHIFPTIIVADLPFV